MEDLFGVVSSCDKFRVRLPRADAFTALKGEYGCHYSIERAFKFFARIRHGQCFSPIFRIDFPIPERSKAEKQSQRFAMPQVEHSLRSREGGDRFWLP